jgi:hypothetical protein
LGFGAGVMNTFKTPNGVAKQTIHNTVGSWGKKQITWEEGERRLIRPLPISDPCAWHLHTLDAPGRPYVVTCLATMKPCPVCQCQCVAQGHPRGNQGVLCLTALVADPKWEPWTTTSAFVTGSSALPVLLHPLDMPQ